MSVSTDCIVGGESHGPPPARGRRGDEASACALACVGAPFRPHGRSVAGGLDCVGLAAIAFGMTPPAGYALRGGDADMIGTAIAALGFVRDADGALLLLATGPHQFHLAVRTTRGFVHADAGLRRVVETPGTPRWPLVSAWQPAPDALREG